SGRTYQIPNYVATRLRAVKNGLDATKRSIDEKEISLDEIAQIIEGEREDLSVHQTSQFSVNSFNQKVNQYNEAGRNLQATIEAYNRRVDAYNSELERVGTLIK